MSIISLLQEFDGKEIAERAGKLITGKLLPGLTPKELSTVQGMIPCALPAQIKDVLTLTRGIKPGLSEIDFSGLSLEQSFEMSDVFPHGLPVAGDGNGNFWVLDLHPSSKDWAPVFYACHDPPVIIWQAKTFEEFVAQLISYSCEEEGNPIELLSEKYAHQIYHENPNVLSAEKAIQPGDPDFSAFAQSLPKGYQFIDLRRPRTGEGFSWGRYGPGTEIKRHGEQRLFAYKKAPGFFERLFRR